MKKRVLGVFLVTLLILSSITVGASAKTNKFVKSIIIKKSATIKIPYNKSSKTKSFKVTVKGTGSGKFTAKSSKSSVASVKVSGSYIKVTAKKAGKTTITVTTKDKSSGGKKLSKKMTVKVKKAQDPVVVSMNVLKAYISSDGETDKDGNKYFKKVMDHEGHIFNFWIVYNPKTKIFTFKSESSYFTLKLGKNKTTKYVCELSNGTAETVIDVKNYNRDDDMKFTLITDEDYEPLLSSYVDFAQADLKLLMTASQLCLMESTSFEVMLSDIGFENY